MATETGSSGDRAPDSPIDDRLDLGNALRLLDKTAPPPMATCPADGEPLVPTFERSGAEFTCVVCGRWYAFCAACEPAESTPELEARLEELTAQYDAARAARNAAAAAEMATAREAR